MIVDAARNEAKFHGALRAKFAGLGLTTEAQDFICRLMTGDPEERITASDVHCLCVATQHSPPCSTHMLCLVGPGRSFMSQVYSSIRAAYNIGNVVHIVKMLKALFNLIEIATQWSAGTQAPVDHEGAGIKHRESLTDERCRNTVNGVKPQKLQKAEHTAADSDDGTCSWPQHG